MRIIGAAAAARDSPLSMTSSVWFSAYGYWATTVAEATLAMHA